MIISNRCHTMLTEIFLFFKCLRGMSFYYLLIDWRAHYWLDSKSQVCPHQFTPVNSKIKYRCSSCNHLNVPLCAVILVILIKRRESRPFWMFVWLKLRKHYNTKIHKSVVVFFTNPSIYRVQRKFTRCIGKHAKLVYVEHKPVN